MTLYTDWFLKTDIIPWRIRNSVECWVERRCAKALPVVHQLLHFNRLRSLARPITIGPNHHFFGYYEKSPWSGNGRYLLTHEAGFNDRPPTAQDKVSIGLIDTLNENRLELVTESFAWNWQQGAMLQWYPTDPSNLFLYNNRKNGCFVGVLSDTNGEIQQEYSRPIYALTSDGRWGLSLNFSRLHKYRPGYGYVGIPDPFETEKHPSEDGIFLVNMQTNDASILVSLDTLAHFNPRPEFSGAPHWVNHIQISPGGERFAFFHIWSTADGGWSVRLFTCNLDGTNLNLLLDTHDISHYDWMDETTLLVWAQRPDAPARFLLCNVQSGDFKVWGDGVLTEDGHCSFSPDREWVLNDTYPDRFDMRTLMLYHPETGRRIDLERLYSPKDKWWGEIRCDLHPRWSRDGKQICIDSVHSGQRQMYIADIGDFI